MSQDPSSSDTTRSRQQRVMDSVGSKAHEVIKEDFDKAKVLVNDAAKSQSYLYPIKVSR
jgi:hypothetical protein